jgi:chromosome segregation ATPase
LIFEAKDGMKFWRKKTMAEQKQEHYSRLLELDAKRQAPQAALAAAIARLRTLEAQLGDAKFRLHGATNQDTVVIKAEIEQMELGIADLVREVHELEKPLKPIDEEWAARHAQIRSLEISEDDAALRQSRDAVWQAEDALRIARAKYCIQEHEFKTKHPGQESTQKASLITQELIARNDAALRAQGWRAVDATWAALGPVQITPLLPPVRKP